MGHRGSKAKRKTIGKIKPHMAPQGMETLPPEIQEQLAREDVTLMDHAMRNQARSTGLIVPPSPAEKAMHEQNNSPTKRFGGGLILP
jgi:hypothetical protein